MKQTSDIMTDTNISEEQSCSTACHTKTQSDAMVFRTDEIVTKPIEVKASDMVRPKVPKERRLCVSEDGKWLVKTMGNSLMIEDRENQTVTMIRLFRMASPVPFGRFGT